MSVLVSNRNTTVRAYEFLHELLRRIRASTMAFSCEMALIFHYRVVGYLLKSYDTNLQVCLYCMVVVRYLSL